jgi:hypothetical protein
MGDPIHIGPGTVELVMLGYNPRIELDGNRSNAGSTDQRPQFQHGMDHGCPTNGARCRPDPNTCNTGGLSKRFIPGEIRFRRSPAERETRGQRDGEPLHTPRRRLFQARTGSCSHGWGFGFRFRGPYNL